MELGQRPELRQKVTLSPQVYQGLSILAMPVAELQVLVEAELLENPLLEVEEFEEAPAEAEEERADAPEEERAWDEWLDRYEELDSAEPVVPRDPNVEDVDTDEFVGGVQTFDDYLISQLGMLDVDEETSRAAKAVIGSLDRDGFFCVGLPEIASIAGVSVETVERALGVVQQLDPPGVGARSLAEALSIQMEYLGLEEPLLTRIVRDHLDDVAANHFRKIARALRVDEEEVRRVVEILRSLNPRPAGAFSPGPSPGYIVPDVTVRRFGDEWVVTANNEAVPPLRVNAKYRGMLRDGSGADKETVRYLKEKIRSAETFIRNIDRRKDTVSRIASIVLEVQSEFFEDGKGPLRPLRLEDVAVEIGVHLSTVSRGVTGKYMATPYGMFELKHFFSGGYRTSTGMDVASTTVKNRLREMLGSEDVAKPLSDQRLAEMLSDEGVPVARRTVAKYREEMGHRALMGEEAPVVSDEQQDAGREADMSARLRDVIIVGVMLAIITGLHQFTSASTPTEHALHDLYRRLYYLPILYSAFRFGSRGGLVTAFASILLYAPHTAVLGGFFGTGIDNLFEVIMFVVMGGLFGRLRDHEARRTQDLMQVSRKLEDAYRVLEERAMQLISIQDYTQSIVRSVTSGVITVGPDGSVATLNPAAERMLGTPEDVVVARTIRTVFKDDGGLAADVARVLEGRVPRTLRDVTIVTRGGKTVHAQASVSRMRDVGGRKLGAVVTIEDVSEIKTLTDQLIRADRLAAMGELTAGVAHEVRNPLGIIRASVQLMEESPDNRVKAHEAAEVIKHEIDRLDRVIKALLDFGRPSVPTMRPVEVRRVLEEVVLFTRKFADRSRVDIVEEYEDGVPEVMGDPEQLKQVFVNLISNAVQAMSDEGGTLTVSVGFEDEFVFARFSDTGPGIPAEAIGKVFDPFFSTRDDGTGLGLTIVHRIVDEHGGHIEVTSDASAGTAFTVSLPALI